MSFIGDDYEIPKGNNLFFKPEAGENKIRILSKAIWGFKGWKTNIESGKDESVRRKERADPDLSGCRDVKSFLAFKIYDFASKEIKIFELTQVSIIGPIVNYAKDEDWGDPHDPETGYGIKITKEGQGKEGTKYTVSVGKPGSLPEEIAILDAETPCNLDALYTNGDPFQDSQQDDDDIPF